MSASDRPANVGRSLALAYTARIAMEGTSLDVDGMRLQLEPGMAVTVEIKTGTRRIIDYLLSPILRHSQESLRER